MQIQIINFNPKKIKNISDEANNLLNGLLNKNPQKRLTCEEILNHPWLQNINFNFHSDNDKYNLFTKAEMTFMSKTYIDYRNGNLEDLRENFTITNLKSDEIKESEKNITAKSSILDPFNSAVEDNKSSINESNEYDIYDDLNNSKLELENDIIIFNNKVKEYNLNYEINNNQEVDNGMMIKTKSDISSSNSNMNISRTNNNKPNDNELSNYHFNEEKNKEKNIYDNNVKNKKYEHILVENNNYNDIDINNPKINEILNQIKNFGFTREYVINCIKNNILCHALLLIIC